VRHSGFQMPNPAAGMPKAAGADAGGCGGEAAAGAGGWSEEASVGAALCCNAVPFSGSLAFGVTVKTGVCRPMQRAARRPRLLQWSALKSCAWLARGKASAAGARMTDSG